MRSDLQGIDLIHQKDSRYQSAILIQEALAL